MTEAKVKWLGGLAFQGENPEGLTVLMDSSPEHGGEGKGARPTEVLLMSMGACSGMDVVSILEKMQQPLRSLEVGIEADRAADHPKVFTAARLVYRVEGDGLVAEKVRRAVSLSLEKYCTVANVVNKSANLSSRIELNGKLLD